MPGPDFKPCRLIDINDNSRNVVCMTDDGGLIRPKVMDGLWGQLRDDFRSGKGVKVQVASKGEKNLIVAVEKSM